MAMNSVYGSDPGVSGEKEGRVAKAIEKRTAKIPSDVFLWAAGASVVGSLVFQVLHQGRRFRFIGGPEFPRLMGSRFGHISLFLGQWAPTFLVLGVYNKLVKTLGSQGAR